MISFEQTENKPGVYLIICWANCRVYVGSSSRVRTRLRHHLNRLRAGEHDNSFLQRTFKKYGERSFTFGAFKYCADLIETERWVLAYFEPDVFNLAPVEIPPMLGRKHSIKTREKISQAKKGQVYPERSQEHRALLATAHRGKKRSAQTRARLKQVHSSDQPHMKALIEAWRIKVKVGDQLFASLKEAGEHFGCCPGTISYHLKRKSLFRGLMVTHG